MSIIGRFLVAAEAISVAYEQVAAPVFCLISLAGRFRCSNASGCLAGSRKWRAAISTTVTTFGRNIVAAGLKLRELVPISQLAYERVD